MSKKQVFYHMKGEKFRQTHLYQTAEGIKDIKSTMRKNGAVLDAIYNESTRKVTVYSKRYPKRDYYDNIIPHSSGKKRR